MNWQHLMYFKKVAECGVLTKAAEDLHLTPSTLSRAINNLEEELEVELIDRQGRSIILNKYGIIFYEYVKRASQEMKNGINVIQSMANVSSGNIRVSSIFSVGTYFIPKLLSEFYKNPENRNIHIELSQLTTQQILTDIIVNKLDIAFCGEFDCRKKYSNINREAIYDEKIMLIVPENHRLAAFAHVSFKDIVDEIFIGYNNNTGIITTIYDAVARRGYPSFRFKTIFNTNEDNNATSLVKEGLGIAFVVDNPSLYAGGIKVMDVSDLSFFRTIYMVWKRDSYLSPAINKLRDAVFLYKSKI